MPIFYAAYYALCAELLRYRRTGFKSRKGAFAPVSTPSQNTSPNLGRLDHGGGYLYTTSQPERKEMHQIDMQGMFAPQSNESRGDEF
jgi:hypothetical protein